MFSKIGQQNILNIGQQNGFKHWSATFHAKGSMVWSESKCCLKFPPYCISSPQAPKVKVTPKVKRRSSDAKVKLE